MPTRVRALVALLPALLAPLAHAAPDLATRRAVSGQIVFADDARAGLWYVTPPEPELATGADGRPDLTLITMRYTGNVLARDRGLLLHRTVLALRVRVPGHDAAALASLARTLGAAEVRPLPLRRVESALVWAPVGVPDSAARVVPGGRLEGDAAAGDAAWRERVFTVALDSLTAQAMHAAMERGQLAISLAYAYVAEGRAGAMPPGDVTGPPELLDELRRRLAAAGDSAARDSAARRVVRAGAFRVGVDVRAWPGVLRRVDVDGQMPAGFAALDLVCFDFRDGRRPDLFEKAVEIEAESVGGRPVRQQVVFARTRPDVFAAGLRFPVAVRLDRPFRWRVTETRPDGSSSAGPWSARADWIALLDVTTPAAPSRGVRPIR